MAKKGKVLHPQVKTPPKEWIIWFAGFFDGEGCISQNTNRGLRLSLSQSEDNGIGKKVMEEILETWGCGYLHIFTTDWSRAKHKRQPQYRWAVYASYQIIEILKLIQPYLKVKRAEAEDALARTPAPNQIYSPEEDSQIKKLYGQIPTKELADKIHRSTAAVYKRAATLGIKIKREVYSNGVLSRR